MIDLTEDRPFRALLVFALPVIGGNLFQLFYTLADSVIVGRTLGADALAAVGATSMIVYFVLCFIQGFTNGFGICLGQRFGAKDTEGMRRSMAASTLLSFLFTVIVTVICCGLAHPILAFISTPEDIYQQAYDYMYIILLGTAAPVFYNLISNILRALGDSRTPLYFLIFSSLLNVALDIIFIVPLHMGVAGAAWATVLSQFLSAFLCLFAGLRSFEVLRLRRSDFKGLGRDLLAHLKIGFPMGFQMSVMCIGQISMQSTVNALGSAAVAGYTAATKVDQLSVLVNNAMMTAISNYVAQNFGAGRKDRILAGLKASLIQTESLNILMCIAILLLRRHIVTLFITEPTDAIFRYANDYLVTVAPFYWLLGLLAVYRTTVQSMQNGAAPFAACMIELVMRLASTIGLTAVIGYMGVCLASPLAWAGACALLIPVYYRMIRKLPGERR